jgi:SAM-dependent methyltransferase
MNRTEMLQQLSLQLFGTGVEFGAGSSPFPVPPGVIVRYADRNTVAQLRDRKYFGDSSLIDPEFCSDLETMEGIAPDSLDFIIASHVIEHTRSPLRAMQQAYRSLRQGGKFVLVVPDKEVTFDRDRALTDLDHLISDFEAPSRDKDWHHYVEFFAKAFPQPDPVSAAKGPFEANHDIHFHTWTYETFADMTTYAQSSISPWSAIWSHPRLSSQDIEFYFVLTK